MMGSILQTYDIRRSKILEERHARRDLASHLSSRLRDPWYPCTAFQGDIYTDTPHVFLAVIQQYENLKIYWQNRVHSIHHIIVGKF